MGLLGNFLHKQNLLNLQKVVMPNAPSNKLVLSEKQLYREAERMAGNDLKIINECTNLINTTVNPDVFFKRYAILRETVAHLSKFSPYIKFKGTQPNQMMLEINRKEQLAISDFLHRYYNSVMEKANSLKTDKGKKNQYKKFYDSLKKYYPLIDEVNIGFIDFCIQSFEHNSQI